MIEELIDLVANRTLDLISCPFNASVISNKWIYSIYSIKVESNGSLDIYKARLVAQGYK